MTAKPTRPRVVFIAGGTSGIGLALARRLAAVGDHLVLMARGAEPLSRTAIECEKAGAASVMTLSTDVGDGAAVRRDVTAVLARHDAIDVLVQSAGVAAYGRFEEMPAAVFDGVLRTNVQGSANLVRAVLPGMRTRDAGSIYLIGSIVGAMAVPEMSPYVISKWAIRSLARELQIENRDRPGVHVTLVTPGGVDTPIYMQAATYTGHIGKPPPPVYRPETVAAKIADSFDHPPTKLNVGASNSLLAMGFSSLPALYNAIVTPLFTLLTKEPDPAPATPGNVLAALPDGNGLRGRHPGLTKIPFRLFRSTRDRTPHM